jgi:hypothetical protein
MDTVRRGYCPTDTRDFTGPALHTLHGAARDLVYLLNRGYPAKGAVTLIGNHCLLSERQRTALARTVSARADLDARAAKRLRPEDIAGREVHIDGFNAVITLEVALSGSPVFVCMDGTYRDLAGLRGTYRLIDKTEPAVRMIVRELKALGAGRAVFWLDQPVSNSGRLKARIAGIAEEEGLSAGFMVTGGVDAALSALPNIVSSDSLILGRCQSWLNLHEKLIPALTGAWIADLWGGEAT